MTPDRPGLWTFHPYPWTGKAPERIPVDFEIREGKMVAVVKSPRWPSSLEDMAKLGVWRGEPTA